MADGTGPASRGVPEADRGDSAAVLGVAPSLSGRRWVWRSALGGPEADRAGLLLAQRLDIPEMVARLLAGRGLTADSAAHFMRPTLRALLPDPSCFTDMDRAAERLARAVNSGETVGVFGDYDVDGACATALLAGLLRALGCTVHTHIPDRIAEGYGPNAPALLRLAEKGAGLVVCVDCGTAAPEPLAALAGHADVIVLDHHKSDGDVPPVLATVNPNRLDCASGQGALCATAIAFLCGVALLRVLRRQGRIGAAPDLLETLDLVALATICDVMPLTGLNRALVTQGLKVMARRARPGLAALLDVAAVREAPSAFTCGYALGPRINAGGRISQADLGVQLLLSDDPMHAAALAERLDGVNRERRGVETAILDRAMALGEEQVQAGHAVLLLAGADWHPGVVGIVAGRLKERFNRPVLVGAMLEDGSVKGSGRSVDGLDLGTVVIAARQSGLLTTGGGHAMAAGFSLPAERLPAFHAFLDRRLAAALLLPRAQELPIEGVMTVQAATVELATEIGRLAPFGAGNAEPLFALSRARVARADRIGGTRNTLRLLLEGEGGGPRLKALLFRADESPVAAMLEQPGPPLHLAGWLRAECWNGSTTPCFFIQDAALA
ncbi:single-stranded-DNA-specific exonuclease RecJ [Acetobacteraceae bacterium KSS8]|uniref:Single-stranded-DNA-specific exonuclease RecJ n=1 Tax=Endosaccharibacter trunci TaxID=2812733 RepID=A0ABT1W870_9PROT|nr:single-stranded-DNA-specific exonuclease RecJ [Acetobacteraceae bacterium KSS8]